MHLRMMIPNNIFLLLMRKNLRNVTSGRRKNPMMRVMDLMGLVTSPKKRLVGLVNSMLIVFDCAKVKVWG